ncbi:Glycosyltransferase, catalytic subunit of cellulose synthase and poly-beta-1,6-N-acetylglucosamine synthase [Methanophagales archaeon]|nr:Glycosyltransferase, catalytic subunit of cellulose synthase and poly-beta-1,6-N-acetylglucosamine synthase [Methanophagales archaeon]
MDIIIILLYLLSALLLWQFVGYPSLMAIVALRSKPKIKDYSFQPFVSIIVATYNEEKVIARRIKNLVELDYHKAKYELIVVDSGSTDNTTEIMEKLIEKYDPSDPPFRLVKEDERRGKASAINFGKKHAKGEIVLVTDANSIYDKNVLNEMMPHFKDSNVGAVSGRYTISNPDKAIPSSEAFYWDIEHIALLGESFLDSISTVIGTISAWRIELMNFRSITISEDLDMTIQVRRKGYKVIYEPEAKVHEPSAITSEDQIKQRKRTSIGTIQNMFEHLGYFIPPRDWYSMLIFPSHKALAMFSPFILLAIPILYLLTWNIDVVFTHFVLTLFVFVVMFALLMFLKSKLMEDRGIKSSFSLSSIPKVVYYVLLNEYLILLAWTDFVFKRYSILWERAESTR